MNNNVTVTIDNLKELQKKIEKGGNELIRVLSKIEMETDKMDKIYDSPTATLFREKKIAYLDDRIKFIRDKYLGLNIILDSIISVYQDTESNLNRMVGGK